MTQPEPERQVPELVPARMVNEFTYCPRLFYLEWVDGQWDDNAFTADGQRIHRRVDGGGGKLPEPADLKEETLHARSVSVSAPGRGIIAKVDLVEAEGQRVTPVDYKRGEAPDPARVPRGVWEADRLQIAAQAAALRESGYECDRGVIYYAGSRRRVDVPIDEELLGTLDTTLVALRTVAAGRVAPPPLVDSPKCSGCSLVGICLPNETRFLQEQEEEALDTEGAGGVERRTLGGLRRLHAARDDSLPLYVQAYGASIHKSGDLLEIRAKDGTVTEARLPSISHVALFGSVRLTPAVIEELCDRGVAVCHFSHGGWFHGMTEGFHSKNIGLRIEQFAAARDPLRCLAIARRIVRAKILNSRTFLRRNHKSVPEAIVRDLKALAEEATGAESLASLLGIEGTAARLYFGEFSGMVRPRSGPSPSFELDGRNRRPPRDPINALLSLAYALLAKDFTIALRTIGFDPLLGFYHQPRYGRPALALDLMEELRPIVADSVVLTAVNNDVVQEDDFVRCAGSVALTEKGRRSFLRAYERRMDQLLAHPVFGYQISYRRTLEVQGRLFARYLLGEIDEYPELLVR